MQSASPLAIALLTHNEPDDGDTRPFRLNLDRFPGDTLSKDRLLFFPVNVNNQVMWYCRYHQHAPIPAKYLPQSCRKNYLAESGG